MNLKENIVKALNEQVNRELFSSYLYLSMAAWFETQTLRGFAAWMRVQSQEEYAHAMKIYDYLVETGSVVKLAALEAPKVKWDNAVQVFEETCAHEAFITSSINKILELAIGEKDYATQNMLQWFVKEQVEEEAAPGEILAKIRMIGGSIGSLLYLDKELGKRGRS